MDDSNFARDHSAAWGNYTYYTDETFGKPFDVDEPCLPITADTFEAVYAQQPLTASKW